MKRLAVLFVFLALAAGCPQEEQRYEYSVDSLSMEGSEHFFSGGYEIFVKLSENSFIEGNTLVISDGEAMVFGQNLTQEIPEGRQLSFEWVAEKTGNHTLRAVLQNSSGSEVSTARSLTIFVQPLGSPEFEEDEFNYPVEAEVWCAQEFTLENRAELHEAQVHLRSLVPTQEGKIVALELRKSTDGVPGEGADGLLAMASIPSTDVQQKPAWYSFPLEKQLPAGSYWLVLKRDHSLGNVAWTYGGGENADGAYCRDLAVSEDWFPIEGSFAFQIR